MAADKRTKGR
jgi:hypothetical protein